MYGTPHAGALVALGAAATFALDVHALTVVGADVPARVAVTRAAEPVEPVARHARIDRSRPQPPAPARAGAVRRQRRSRVVSRPRPVATAVVRTARPAPPPAPSGPTRWPDLNRAIARIPTYDGGARWVVHADDGHWGTAILETSTILISPRVPVRLLYDVAVHEWSHLLSVRAYGGDRRLALAEMNRVFGGGGMTGAERAADCMARLQGASWTNYTPCTDAGWRAAAGRLVRGHRLDGGTR